MSAMIWYQCTDTDIVCLQALSQNSEPTCPSGLLTPAHRALAYGDGFFTTMGVYHCEILWQSYHESRLSSHIEALDLYLPLGQWQLVWQTVATFASDIIHGIIKIIVSRQAQALRGYAYSSNITDNACDIYIGVMQTPPLATQTTLLTSHTTALQPYTPILQQPPITAVCLNSQLACLPKRIAGLKTLNRLDSVLIAGELETYKKSNHLIGEGLVQDITGCWVEGVMSNVFYQLSANVEIEPNINTGIQSHSDATSNRDKSRQNHGSQNQNDDCQISDSQFSDSQISDSQWYTPPIESSGVRGIMRQVIVDKFAETNNPIGLRPLIDKDLANIEGLFFCNAVRGVIPVDNLILPSGQDMTLSTAFPH